MKYFIKALKHYADFSGRASRKEYWMFVLFSMIFAFVWIFLSVSAYVYTVPCKLGNPFCTEHYNGFEIATYWSYAIVMFLPGLALTARRLHDVGKSGWMLLISLVPFVGGIWLFILMITDGKQGNNKYGSDPKISPETFDESTRLKSLGVVLAGYSFISTLNSFYRGSFIAAITFILLFVGLVGAGIWLLMLANGHLRESKFVPNPKTLSKVFGDPKKLKNTSFVLIVSFIVLSLLLYYKVFPITKVTDFLFDVVPFFILGIFMLFAGILLMSKNPLYGMRNNWRDAIILLLVVYSIYYIWGTWDLISYVKDNGWDKLNFFVKKGIWILIILPIIFLTVSFLFSMRNKILIRIIAILGTVFSILYLLFNIYSYLIKADSYSAFYTNFTSYEQIYYTLLDLWYTISFSILCIVLTATFLSLSNKSTSDLFSKSVCETETH